MSNPIAVSGNTLAAARRTASHASASMTEVVERAKRMSALALGVFLIDILACVAVFRWVSPSAESRLLAAFMAVSGLTLLVLTGLGAGSALWSAYLAEHSRRLEADEGLLEATALHAAIISSINSPETRARLLRVCLQRVVRSGDLSVNQEELIVELSQDPVLSAECARVLTEGQWEDASEMLAAAQPSKTSKAG